MYFKWGVELLPRSLIWKGYEIWKTYRGYR